MLYDVLPQKDNKISTIIVSVVSVGQEIVDERGQADDQVHSSDSVELVLSGYV